MYFEEFKKGFTAELAPAVIDREEMLDFARKYDNIPLHTDEEYAKNTFFGGVIAPGLMSFAAVWAKYLENDLAGEELLAGKSSKIEWFAPVYPGDALSGRLTITELTKRSEKNGIVEMKIEVYNQSGKLVLENITEMIVKCRGEKYD